MINAEEKEKTKNDEKSQADQDPPGVLQKSNKREISEHSSKDKLEKSKKVDATGSSQVDELQSINFKCRLCHLDESCEYYGKSPPWSPRTNLLEEVYIMRDPFSLPQKKQILIIGGKCSLCNMDVCVSTRCSLFFSKRFCKECAVKNVTYFPSQIQMKIKKNLG